MPEKPSGDRRNRLQMRFNRGYRGFQQTYRTCTPAADLVIRRYLDEGSKIAGDPPGALFELAGRSRSDMRLSW